MNSLEVINAVCSDLGISKSELAKKMGVVPSALYRKLNRDSMTLRELQKCLILCGVSITVGVQYPDGSRKSMEAGNEILLEKVNVLSANLSASERTVAFLQKSLRDLRSELANARGYAELGKCHSDHAVGDFDRILSSLDGVERSVAYALGEELLSEEDSDAPIYPERLHGKRVLIVDDNKLNRQILAQVLTEYGLDAQEAGDGAEAVAMVEQNEPGFFQCILMDIEMPGTDGFVTTRNIRGLHNRLRANTPIIALTANTAGEIRERASAVGMDGFLAKPVGTQRLLRNLQALM